MSGTSPSTIIVANAAVVTAVASVAIAFGVILAEVRESVSRVESNLREDIARVETGLREEVRENRELLIMMLSSERDFAGGDAPSLAESAEGNEQGEEQR
ncbi:MAG: hypothetical protein MPK07_01100 [Alphaproteobacteria bacterium]|nr:hypothetical protein [Alphaproteobacteria bacterium]MDA8012516.1 hypothetical protein [Alphaproteobacteria bacterium]